MSDMNANEKAISLSQFAMLWEKAKERFVDKEEGKGLSTNDYTDEEKALLAALSTSVTYHIGDDDIHVSEEDRTLWNSKVTAYRNASGSLVLSYELPPDQIEE